MGRFTPLTAETADLSVFADAVKAAGVTFTPEQTSVGSGRDVPSVLVLRFANGYGLSIARGGICYADETTADVQVMDYRTDRKRGRMVGDSPYAWSTVDEVADLAQSVAAGIVA